LKTLEARTLEQWRSWLAAHHGSEPEVWLVFYKKHTGQESVTYGDALDEALCFGWIDSLVKRLDDDRFARKFTPRKPDSKWSSANRKRYAQLKAGGRLKPAGLSRPPTERSGDAPRPSLSEIPEYVQEALRKHPAAASTFESLAPSHRRAYLGWIDSAKRQETKMKRLDEAIRMLTTGEKLGLK
jgi:uncharacterized protein YdeI (YjbR/CyaY-like superfamily)